MLHRRVIVALILSTSCSTVYGQNFDPRPTLISLIQAFQRCGPPQAYQVLSPPLFQLIAQQTSGRGCYPQIAAAGPIIDAQILDQRQFAVGPLFVVRVAHQAAAVDWFIGFNRVTGRVELLTFQAAAQTPTIDSGPAPTSKGPSKPPKDPAPSPSGSDDGCNLYPAMCQ